MSAGGDKQNSTGKTDWRTPPIMVHRLEMEIGHKFTMDVAATEENKVAREFLTGPCEESSTCNCGLCGDWWGHVFCNPPYGRGVKDWVNKAITEMGKGYTHSITLLLPANTGTKWFASLYNIHAKITFLTGRIPFLDDEGKPANNNTVDSMVVVIDRNLYRDRGGMRIVQKGYYLDK